MRNYEGFTFYKLFFFEQNQGSSKTWNRISVSFHVMVESKSVKRKFLATHVQLNKHFNWLSIPGFIYLATVSHVAFCSVRKINVRSMKLKVLPFYIIRIVTLQLNHYYIHCSTNSTHMLMQGIFMSLSFCDCFW